MELIPGQMAEWLIDVLPRRVLIVLFTIVSATSLAGFAWLLSR